LLLLATIALVSPSAIARTDLAAGAVMTQKLSLGLAVLLIVGYGLGLLFSLKTHREIFAGAEHPPAEAGEPAWPIGLALGTLAVVTLLVALVSEIFVESVQEAAKIFGMSPAFVGFVVVALVGGAAEMTVALSAARKDRLDLSVGSRSAARPKSRSSSAPCWCFSATSSDRRRWTSNSGLARW
jgi:Ca2+:H+ antiporter